MSRRIDKNLELVDFIKISRLQLLGYVAGLSVKQSEFKTVSFDQDRTWFAEKCREHSVLFAYQASPAELFKQVDGKSSTVVVKIPAPLLVPNPTDLIHST